MPACDWGKPCDCSECREQKQSSTDKICSNCSTQTNAHLFKFYMSISGDHKGMSSYEGKYRCLECDVQNTRAMALEREEALKIRKKHAKDCKIATDMFFKHVRELEAHHSGGDDDHVQLNLKPIKLLYEKLGIKFPRYYKSVFSKIPFNIIKRNKRYYCNEHLINNINVSLFNKYIQFYK